MAGLPPKYIRHKFLDTAGPKELNQYLRDLESLSKKQGGGYTQAFEEDKNHILGDIDSHTVVQNILQLGGGLTNRKKPDGPLDLKEGRYCETRTGEISCTHRASELRNIQQTIYDAAQRKVKKDDVWQKAIRDFFDFSLCCPHLFDEKIPESIFRISIDDTLETINKNDFMLEYAFNQVWPIWINEQDNTFDRELYDSYNQYLRNKDQPSKQKLLAELNKHIKEKEQRGKTQSRSKWLTTAIYISIFKAAKNLYKCSKN